MGEQDSKVGPTFRYTEPSKPFEFAIGDSENIEAISAHITRHVGPVETVFHEIISDKVHIDVHIVAPSEKFPFYTLVTSGMSDRAMKAPEKYARFAHAELFICLPPAWKMEQADWKDEANYWPVRWLKTLARFPHEYDAWLWWGHTMPHGDPPAPIHPSTALSAFLLLQNFRLPDAFRTLKISEEKTIHFLSLVPLYSDELEYKFKHGGEGIESRFKQTGLSEVLDIKRPSCLPKPGFFARLFGK
jgi:hypothetical protein